MRMPVIVLSGFLGSGKTTLLLRLLEEANNRGLMPGVLMNELGKMDVDGLILQERSNASVQKLLDGCVCCSKKSELLGALRTLADRKPDLIVIELTGVANPEEIADALTEPELLRVVRLNQVVTVLDAEHVLDYNSIFASDKQLVRTLRRQIETADRLVLNKTDLIGAAQLSKIEKTIRKYNERAPIVPTMHCAFDLNPLFTGIEKGTAVNRPAAVKRTFGELKPATGGAAGREPKRDERSFSRIRSLSLPWNENGRASAAGLERFLRGWREPLLRAKGYVRFKGDPATYLMQYAGGRASWVKSDYSGEPYVVMIGIGLDEERLAQQWSLTFG